MNAKAKKSAIIRRYLGLAGCLALFFFLDGRPAGAQSAPIESKVPTSTKENPLLTLKVREAQNSLDDQDFDSAYSSFQAALGLAIQGGNRKWEEDCYFYLGLTRQQQAEKLGKGPAAEKAIAESEKYYKQALSRRPNSASILNNLAQLYVLSGRDQEAQQLLSKTVSLAGPQQSVVPAQNYAALLDRTGDSKGASQYYAQAAVSQSDNMDAHERAVAAFLKGDPHGLGPYLWGALKNGQVLRVEESAIEALQQRDWEPAERKELLAIIAASLSQQSYDPATYKDTFAAKNLASFSGDAVIGGGVVELLGVHSGVALDPAKFHWWPEAGDFNTDPPRGVWPRDAFRSLIRSLGGWHQRRGAYPQAEAYYRLAVNLSRREIDPVACLALADLYIAQDRIGDLDHLMDTLAPELFYGKGEAYRSSQWQKIYEFHRALGLIYSYLKRWGNSGTPTSAIFQLEHAMEVAARLKKQPEPRLVDSLAAAYENSNQFERGSTLRLRYAEERIGQKDYLSARELLAPVAKQKASGKLAAANALRYEKAMESLPQQARKY